MDCTLSSMIDWLIEIVSPVLGMRLRVVPE